MEAKIKNTPARSAITQIFKNTNSPIDVEQIISFLRSKNLKTNKVTVYRIVDFLYKNGLVDRLEFGEGKFRYEAKKEDHHHLICNSCNAVEDVSDVFIDKFEKDIRKKGFLVKAHSLEFFGICKQCQQ